MNVKELIMELKRFDKDLQVVYCSDPDYTEGEITYAKLFERPTKPNEVWLGG